MTELLVNAGHRPLVDHITAAVLREHPAYERLRDGAGLRAAVSGLSRVYCATVAEHRRVSAKEAIGLQVLGAQRARQGLHEDEIVSSVRTAVRAGWGCFTEALAQHCDSAAELQSITARLFDQTDVFVEDVLLALRQGWRAEHDQQLPGQLRAQAAVVDRLVEGEWDDGALCDFAREQGVPVLAPLALLLITGPRGVEGRVLRNAAGDVADLVKGLVEGPLRMTGTPRVIVLVNEAHEDRMAALHAAAADVARRHGVTVALSAPVAFPSGLAETYERLAVDLEFAPMARPRGGMVATDELQLYRLLAMLPMSERTDFALRMLGDLATLPDHKRADLLDTFEAWLWGGSVREATTWMHGVSQPTVRYRLRRVEALTGRRVDRPGESLLIQLAVRMFRTWVEPLQQHP
ncbi:MAG: helix-turn-helix domain-containing protein [Actinomycetota bacterium]|nr:helix-turn-helix domain-containing protein [Actinomycetota bacterium]